MAILDGIVGCWSPSLGATGYRLLDRTQYDNHGTLTNMDAGTDWVASSAGVVLDFDGTNDYVRVEKSPSYLSVSVWIRNVTAPGSGVGTILESYSAGVPSGGIIVYVDTSGKVFFDGRNGSGYISTGPSLTTVTTGTHHVVGQWINGDWQLWVNGKLEASTTSAMFQTRPDINIGGLNTSTGDGAPSGNYYRGQLGEIAIWSSGIPSSAIGDLFRLGNGWIGRELTGVNRRRRFGCAPAFKAAWALRQRLILGGGGGLG